MGCQQATKVDGIDIQRVTVAGDPGRRARIAVRHTKAAAFVIDEAVEGYFSFRTEIELYGVRSRQLFHVFAAAFGMKLLRYAVDCPVVNAVLPVAPFQGLPVQIANVAEHPVDEEVLLHKADEAFDLSLRERMPRLTELRLKADGLHERLIILLPYRMSLQIPADDHALHIVRKDEARNAHVLKGVDHTDEEVFCLALGKNST